MNAAMPNVETPALTFTHFLASTRLGARLARRLCVAELGSWGVPQPLVERAELVVAELASNAVIHGREPDRAIGRVFRLTLVFSPLTRRLRVEVSDARGDLSPRVPPPEMTHIAETMDASGAAELRTSGRGLALVSALADRWDTIPRPPTGKTVRAYLSSTTDAPGAPPVR